MKKLSLISLLFLTFFSFSQINEQFSDGNYTENPVWTGSTDNFIINTDFQLQSSAKETSKSFLFTPSEAFDDATWECWVKINYPTSSSNYASVYISSDRNDSIDNCNAYYVQIGGTNDEISLFLQQGTKKTKIIAGERKRIETDTVEVRIKVTRDREGKFALYSKLPAEADYFKEGEVHNTVIKKGDYFGLMFSNTSKTGHCYLFDDVFVLGDKVVDAEAPEWISSKIIQPDKLLLTFSETMDFTHALFEVDNNMGYSIKQEISSDECSILLQFSESFEKGILYAIKTEYLSDIAGNLLENDKKKFGIAEQIEPGDIILNEIMFEQPDNSYEYIEIYNVSGKLVDVSEIIFTTRKTDGSLNSGTYRPEECLLPSGAYLAVSENAEVVSNYHNCPPGSNIISIKWSSLNNQEATIVLTDKSKEIIFDELTYNTKWHHPLIKNPKGVSLERISPLFETQTSDSWHSASSETNYGTPGYCNSQHRDINAETVEEKFVWLEPEAFSPDNDGTDDVCFIHYITDEPGYAANVIILNASGVEVCRLAANIMFSTQGTIIWDGKTNKGDNANIGLYVLYFEMFHSQKGIKKQVKLPLVVSGR